ncbi:glycine cleavage system protein GcvH [Segnochrobactrum spirostomi]|uniref:Glycine cleavage system H protein n=1 Tax=Segnochrobactrum spirostomi TaxID=2608987 RepID=A0A6A7Y465_9HYPH|nr:glycine cleavage system protein GcvH [Segnochrobactrum spirostomi]MQT13920.1 glycine cleavage system protein GcvH [Segnochrobactrum spirostomi]
MSVRYTQDHEWVRLDGDVATVGITKYAQEQLGDVVFVELPEIGRTVTKGVELAVVESVKAASDVFAPLAGEVVEVNSALPDAPQGVNEDPEGAAWFVKLRVADQGEFDGLMDAVSYKAFVDSL